MEPNRPVDLPGVPLGSEVGYIHTRQFLGWVRTGQLPVPGRLRSTDSGQWYIEAPDGARQYLVVSDYAERGATVPEADPTARILEVRELRRTGQYTGMARLAR